MIEDKGIRFSGEEFMELWRSSTELEASYNSLKRKCEHLEDYMIKLESRIRKLEDIEDIRNEHDPTLFEPKEDI